MNHIGSHLVWTHFILRLKITLDLDIECAVSNVMRLNSIRYQFGMRSKDSSVQSVYRCMYPLNLNHIALAINKI